MKLIVIGANGFIGGELYRLAQKKKIKVIGTTTKRNHDKFYPLDMTANNVEIVLDEILKKNNFDGSKEPVYAVIAAAISNIQQCYENNTLSAAVNLIGTKKLLSYFYKNKIITLFLSSDAVFDGKKGNYSEADPIHPLCQYGKQKAEIELFIQQYMPEFLIYRLTKAIGSSLQQNHLLREIYERHLHNEEIKCIEGLLFCPTYVNDVARCILLGLEKGLTGLYHVANPEQFSRYALTTKVLQALHSNLLVTAEPEGFFHFTEPKALNTTLNMDKFNHVAKLEFTLLDCVISAFIEQIKMQDKVAKANE